MGANRATRALKVDYSGEVNVISEQFPIGPLCYLCILTFFKGLVGYNILPLLAIIQILFPYILHFLHDTIYEVLGIFMSTMFSFLEVTRLFPLSFGCYSINIAFGQESCFLWNKIFGD
ncbi:hypothetical protein ACH5RR_039734 [Cinchona calisaya]|uniref:Uncharacterized protein n=1 Tax=Cinchona calisaya TaxID=153742 RepID=A0ABD2Y0T7_9GENT